MHLYVNEWNKHPKHSASGESIITNQICIRWRFWDLLAEVWLLKSDYKIRCLKNLVSCTLKEHMCNLKDYALPFNLSREAFMWRVCQTSAPTSACNTYILLCRLVMEATWLFLASSLAPLVQVWPAKLKGSNSKHPGNHLRDNTTGPSSHTSAVISSSISCALP